MELEKQTFNCEIGLLIFRNHKEYPILAMTGIHYEKYPILIKFKCDNTDHIINSCIKKIKEDLNIDTEGDSYAVISQFNEGSLYHILCMIDGEFNLTSGEYDWYSINSCINSDDLDMTAAICKNILLSNAKFNN